MNTIHSLDAVAFLKNKNSSSVDLILTDPPYEINYKDGIARNPLKAIQNDTIGSVDWEGFFIEASRVLKDRKVVYVHCRIEMITRIFNAAQSAGLKYAHDFVWLKGDMGYGNLNVMGTTHEMIIAFSKGNAEKSRQLNVDGVIKKRTPAVYYGKLSTKENYGHPTQKPIELLAYIILNRTDKSDLVVDPFSGSGSTALAASLLSRNFSCSDIDEEFVKLAQERLIDDEHKKIYTHISNEVLTKNLIGYKFQTAKQSLVSF